jgi:hypothetical protein
MAIQSTAATRTIPTQASGVPLRVRIAQDLMLFVGIVGTLGVTYFTMIEPEAGINALDGLVAALLLIGSLGYIAAGRKLTTGDSEIWAAATGFTLLHLALSAVKVFGFDETEAISFLVMDGIIAGILLAGRPEFGSQIELVRQPSN